MNKVLIISSTGMGDCLWGTPGFRALKDAFPKIKIDLVVNRAWKPLFVFNPYLNKIFEYEEKWYLQPILGVQLFQQKYDVVFIFHANRNFKRILPWLRKFPVWCHQNLEWVKEPHRIKTDATVHGIKRRLIMLERFGVKPNEGEMEIFFDQKTLTQAQEILSARNFSSGKFIYMNLGAAVESRRWMVDSFIELSNRVLKTTSWNIVLGGGPNEKERALKISNELDSTRVMEVCSQPILANANLISKAGLMVTSDTGPMHIGFSMKTPVVALFGTISPIGSGPHEIPEHLCRIITVDAKEEENAGESDPGKFHFRNITVDAVWEQVEKMIAENSNSQQI